jgi:hypothetical protein
VLRVLRVLRERVLVRRLAVPRDAVLRDLDAPVERFAADFFAAGLLREAPVPLDFARVERAFVGLDLARVAFRPDALRALVLRRVVPDAERPRSPVTPPPPEASTDHLPDMTRCAASATASAISEPSFVALAATLLAACCAVSAASRPASRILRRAAGLALIAAAAAARPAASISLLIAAFANLSTPDCDDRPDDAEDDFEDVRVEEVLGDFAICFLSLRRMEKDTLAP